MTQELAGLPYPSWLEFPPRTFDARSDTVLVRGWIAVPDARTVDGPFLVAEGARLPLEREERPDVQRVYPALQVVGFRRFVEVSGSLAGNEWTLEFRIDGITYRPDLCRGPSQEAVEEARITKSQKLARLEPHLACPALGHGQSRCGGELGRTDGVLTCARCGAKYGATGRLFDFLSPDLRSVANLATTDSVSGWGYDSIALDLINRYRDGLVLDNGSGYKIDARDNVVNLEIVDYPSTDILAVGESLPFADSTFDAVLSLAVLEHVRDPFQCAAEIARVMRPGGTVYAAVPFLQPYHGYPHHYYNMTRQGLENLFEPAFTIEESATPPYGFPIWTLTWFLNSYVAGLPPEIAERFKNMRVEELLGSGGDHLGHDYVQQLSPSVTTELASVNYVIATRR